jgi:hypothetical protein
MILIGIVQWEMEGDMAVQFELNRHSYSFPDEDLLPQLVDAYFVNYNAYVPLLHQPTFQYNINEKAHLHDNGFGAVLLVVCALGSRFVDDSRVYVPGYGMRSSGWRWFNQVQITRRPLLNRPRLCDVQLYLLSSYFLSASSRPSSVWMLVGISLRMVTDIGAHRQSFYSKTPNARDELWKRAFW